MASTTFDAGAAWSNFALQAFLSGWHTHGMAGFDRDKARTLLGLPPDYAADAAIAIGRLGDKAILPESLQSREVPSSRKPLSSIVSEGTFRGEETRPIPLSVIAGLDPAIQFFVEILWMPGSSPGMTVLESTKI